MSKKKERLYVIASLIVIIAILYMSFDFGNSSDRKTCPYKVLGNPEADFVIKYIDSPYCVWCWLQEPILKKAVREKGDSLRLEKYDIRYCTEIVKKYQFSGTPSFVFSLTSEEKEYSHMGFIAEEDFNKIICGATGDC